MNTIQHMLRIVETGRRLVLEMPWCRDFPGEFAAVTKIDPADLQYRLTFGSQAHAEGKITSPARIEIDMS